MKKLLGNKEMQEIFGVTRYTLLNWRKKGMPSVKVGGLIKYDLDAVEKWVEEQNK
jgi:phage terminase Nu1 subunit (DNA packaging protein)